MASQLPIQLLENKLLEILAESRKALEHSDKITFGNTYVTQMKANCHNINRQIAEALSLLGRARKN